MDWYIEVMEGGENTRYLMENYLKAKKANAKLKELMELEKTNYLE